MPVEILNRTPLALAFMAGKVTGSTHQLTVMVKGAFTLSPGAIAAPAERPLLEGDSQWDDDPEASARAASDFAPFKPRADATLTGTCHVVGPEPRGTARGGFTVGKMHKELAVFGDRYWLPEAAGGGPSKPAPFRSMPLRYERAFGGKGFGANPVGKGAIAVPSKGGPELWPLPNVELASRLMRSVRDRPAPAGFAPLDRRWAQRRARMGTYDAAWLEKRWPWFPEDFDWGYFNAAPEDQQIADYLRGDEPLVFEGMHPEVTRYEARLPGLRPRCFLKRTAGAGPPLDEVRLNLDTLSIDLDKGTLALVWRGLSPAESRDFAEVEKALLFVEAMQDEPRPAADYHAPVRWQRQAPSQQELASADEDAARGDDDAPPISPAPPSAPNENAAEQAEVEALRAELVEAGADAALLQRLKGVTGLAVLSAILVENLEQDVPAEAKPDREASDARAEEGDKDELDRIRDELEAAGADPTLLARAAAATSLVGLLEIFLDAFPPGTSPAEKKQRDELIESLRKLDADAEAAVLAAEGARRVVRGDRLARDEVVAMAASGGSLAEANLTELDLSGLALRGVNLAGARLDGAKLSKADLSGADLTGASLRLSDLSHALGSETILQGADLEGATLQSADLSRAQLGKANLSHGQLERAKLDEADLTGARLAHANLDGASMRGALLDAADLRGATLRGARAEKAKLRRALLGGADLSGAKLDGASLIRCTMDATRLDGASLRDAHFDEAAGKDVSFAGADVTGARANGASFPGGRFDKLGGAGSRWLGADLSGADFGGAVLTGAVAAGALLQGASFERALLQGADLSHAKLVGAKLTRANLFRARLGAADLTDADCRGSNLFECELFEAVTTHTRFETANLKRTCLDRRMPS